MVRPDARASKGNAEATGFDDVYRKLIRDRRDLRGCPITGLVSRQLPVATLLLVRSRRGPSRPRSSLQREKQRIARERPPIEDPPKAVPGHRWICRGTPCPPPFPRVLAPSTPARGMRCRGAGGILAMMPALA